ncbi:beta-N-acetylhexosaminidase [Actibacterium lipolyticum]|uniref:beta-N-acetylhexosaminidase n=1 Tax=Actibacterium lipolyticum TaxID=1524263 RepID=A0A238KGL2_9RHOB|nr:beta-N-acetylhexosaminidase [Actibacterium lipolyticum]SMX41787.1 Beta-hexosaminidase [Actibacterium lipolyticum]
MSLAGVGACFFGCTGLSLSEDERAFFKDANPYGFILFARNIDTPDQIRRLTADLRDAVGRDAPILIDQEGGRVQRLEAPQWRKWLPPLEEVQNAGDRATEIMRLRYQIIAAELRDLGIDVNCAPMADVARAETHPFLKNRCYGTDPARVAEIARAVSDGLLAGGVLPVLKHIPGHGPATADSHLELPHVDLPRRTLEEVDFAPFRDLADLPFAMTAHVVYESIDAERPATTSPTMVNLMRTDMGFSGFLMSDDISMHALSGDMAGRCTASLQAGCDGILHCNGDMAEMIVIAEASGTFTPIAAQRAEAALAGRSAPAGDLQALTDAWEATLAEASDG